MILNKPTDTKPLYLPCCQHSLSFTAGNQPFPLPDKQREGNPLNPRPLSGVVSTYLFTQTSCNGAEMKAFLADTDGSCIGTSSQLYWPTPLYKSVNKTSGPTGFKE